MAVVDMSADLLAEFDSFYQAPSAQQPKSSTSALGDLSSFGISSQASDSHNEHKESKWQAPSARRTEDTWGNMTAFKPSNARRVPESQSDIWGDFTAAETTTISSPAKPFTPVAQHKQEAVQAKPKPPVLRRDTLEMFSSQELDGWDTPVESRSRKTPSRNTMTTIPGSAPPQKTTFDGDVLFDADNLSASDDDFGDFEDASGPDPVQHQAKESSFTGTQDLVDIFGSMSVDTADQLQRAAQLSPTSPNFDSRNLPYPQAPKSPSFQERNPFADLGVSTNQVSKLKNQTKEGSPVTPWPDFAPQVPEPYQDSPAVNNEAEDDWGDFEAPSDQPQVESKRNGIDADAWAWDTIDGVKVNNVKPSKTNTSKRNDTKIDNWEWSAVDGKSENTVAPDAHDNPPPTNIPPPSVLLPLFPSLFDLPNSKLFKQMEGQTSSLKNKILSDPSTVEFLRAYLFIAKVAAYIIAGRKNRWKRDTLLSQAMKIGPSAAGGKGGMKLAGVDRAEITREEREVADTVRSWKEQLGRLKSAVAVANTGIHDVNNQLVIPEISEVMHVRNQPGSITAPKQCVICGLRREERVSKVDIIVEDSFGEWWFEHWGHRSCRNFWLEHESKLKHR